MIILETVIGRQVDSNRRVIPSLLEDFLEKLKALLAQRDVSADRCQFRGIERAGAKFFNLFAGDVINHKGDNLD
jgi:hypothetical protein